MNWKIAGARADGYGITLALEAAGEVVQCYVRNLGASVEQPVRSLKGFVRVTLAPGESKPVTFPLGFNELSFITSKTQQPSKRRNTRSGSEAVRWPTHMLHLWWPGPGKGQLHINSASIVALRSDL